MKHSAFWGNPFKKPVADIESEIKFLSSVAIFDTLSTRQLEKIHELIHVRRYEEGEIIFRQGDPGVGMYIVSEGHVDVYNEYNDMTRRKIAEIHRGDFFGEISLLNDSPRSATTVALTKTTLFGLFRPDLLGLIDSDTKLGFRFIYRLSQIVAERLRLTSLETTG